MSGQIRHPRHSDALHTLYYTNNKVIENSTLAAKPVSHINIWQPTCDCNLRNVIYMACH